MSATLVRAHRRDVEELLRLALNDLGLVWRQVTTADAARAALLDLLPDLAAVYGSAAATLGADWYDEMRDAAAVPGRFRAIPAEPEIDRTDALARWAVGPLFSATPDFDAAKALAAGGFQRLVADADRHTVLLSSKHDPRGGRWSRQTTGKSCDFCLTLAGRGAVYRTAETADFRSHDHCDCLATPEFG